jgi:polysaccharide biosynthesis protein PslG
MRGRMREHRTMILRFRQIPEQTRKLGQARSGSMANEHAFGPLGRVQGTALAILLTVFVVFAFLPSESNSLARYSFQSSFPSTDPVSSSFFGMTINHPDSTPWPSIPFASMRTWDAGGAWANINPAPGVYAWQQLDWLIHLSENHAVDLVFVFGLTPRWASSKPNAPTPYGPGFCAPPAEAKYWDEFVQAVVMHAHARIKFWEIWNEPQDPQFYCGDIAAMADLQRRAYRIIKTLDPAAVVLTPSPVGKAGFRWMSDFLATGAGDYADVMAFHGYWDTTAESVNPVIDAYKQIFAASGQGNKPIWDTEASWGQNSRLPDSDRQAAFLAKYYLLHWSAGVSRLFWYSYDNVLFGGLWDRTSGLHKAGMAYRETQNWMVDAAMLKPCVELESIWTCDFSRPNGYRATAIWHSYGQVAYRPSSQFRQYRDLDGHKWQIKGPLPLTGKPILLENMQGY